MNAPAKELIPEQVYRDAIRAGLLHWGYGELTAPELENVVGGEADNPGVRALVELAYRAGYSAALR